MKLFASIVAAVLFSAVAMCADDLFTMELSARADTQQQTAHGQPAPSPASSAPRPVLTARSRTRIRIQWSVVNQQKTGTMPDVTLHLLLDKDQKDAVYESALVMDFAPQAKSSADFVVEAPAPGNYRLRLETIGAARTHGHEHAATMDVKVIP